MITPCRFWCWYVVFCDKSLKERMEVGCCREEGWRLEFLGVAAPSVSTCSPTKTRALLRHRSHPYWTARGQQPLCHTCTPGSRNTPGVDAIVALGIRIARLSLRKNQSYNPYLTLIALLFALLFLDSLRHCKPPATLHRQEVPSLPASFLTQVRAWCQSIRGAPVTSAPF